MDLSSGDWCTRGIVFFITLSDVTHFDGFESEGDLDKANMSKIVQDSSEFCDIPKAVGSESCVYNEI